MTTYEQYYPQYPSNSTPLRPRQSTIPQSIVRRRMAVILSIVLLLIVPALVALRPDVTVASAGTEAGVTAASMAGETAADTSTESQPSAVAGALSPAFTPEVRHWESHIVRWAETFGLDPNLAAIIMQIESCGDPAAVSSAGAQGLFQVMPFHFAAGENSLDPDTNAQRGLTYFVERLNQTSGDVGRAFAGYNGGHVAAAAGWDQWLPETQRYFVWSTGIYQDIQSGLEQSPTLQEWLAAGGASLCRQAATRLGL